MSYRLSLLISLGLLFMTSCYYRHDSVPVPVLRNDRYDYGSWNAYASSGKPNIHLIILHPGTDSPMVWLTNQTIDINTDNRDAILKKCPTDSADNETAVYFTPDRQNHPITIYFNSDGTVDHVSLKTEAVISVDKNSEKLTLPCSRDELLRVFGKPKKIVMSP